MFDRSQISMTTKDVRYLSLLAKQFPSIDAAVTEIINLRAILGLPKGTEHFVSDIHGEYESFIHVLKTASGVIRRKIDDVFGSTLSQEEKDKLATIIYYPEQKLDALAEENFIDEAWYRETLHRLVRVCRMVTSKYTRSKVRKALPRNFGYIIEELLHEDEFGDHKHDYYSEILNTIIQSGKANAFVTVLSNLIQRLAVDKLHVLGDIYDRGPGADIILDKLMEHHSLEIQWGNHDILWMGAAAGSDVCIATAMRISLRYGNLDMLREGYGIDISELATFALDFYNGDLCKAFKPKVDNDSLTEKESDLIAKMHKAISMIEFKLTAQLIERRPEFQMDDRKILDRIHFADGTISLYGATYTLNDTHFPTVNPKDPFALTPEEEVVVRKLRAAFMNSEKLQKHVRFLFAKGRMYLCYNSNLIFHGCIPLTAEGKLQTFNFHGTPLHGKTLMDWFDTVARQGYFSRSEQLRQGGQDFMWYLWAGKDSPLFGKNRMTTFERYFIDDKAAHAEAKNGYFSHRDNVTVCRMMLEEFGLNPENSHIVNGHVPVKVKKGENPVKAEGKLLVIDGGFAKAYQKETGIAGYTLIYNSHGLIMTAHKPFESTAKAIREDLDVCPERFIIEKSQEGIRIRDTDIGRQLLVQIEDLACLIEAYKRGLVPT